jgi:hypothetical protein
MTKNVKGGVFPPMLDLTVDRFAAFRSWIEKWHDYVLLSDLEKKPQAYQAAMLRYTFSSETRNIYESLNLTENEKTDPAIILEKMEVFAKGIINETLERHKYFKRFQEDGECFDDFLTEVKLLSKNCNFCNTEDCFGSLLRDKIVYGIRCDKVREKLLSEKTLTLDKAVEICRSSEKAQDGVSELRNNSSESVDRIGKQLYSKNKFNSPSKNSDNRDFKFNSLVCKFCLKRHPFVRRLCPALGKKCRDCNIMNRFSNSSVCLKAKANIPDRCIDQQNDSNNSSSTQHLGALFLGRVGADCADIPWEIQLKVK